VEQKRNKIREEKQTLLYKKKKDRDNNRRKIIELPSNAGSC
jgi:hypothetical protein